jgi:predicted RNase H-like nuclease (RuvC/YqgF family)
MGRSAHAVPAVKGESGGVGDLDTLFAEIARLLARSAAEDDPACLERTLTDGYARALAIEAERARLRRRIGEMTASIDRNGSAAVGELSTLARRLEAEDFTLEQLRDELRRLRERHSLAVRGPAA